MKMAKQGIDVIDAVVCSNKEGNKSNKNDHGSGNILEAPAHASSQQKKVRCGEYERKGTKKKDA